MLKCQFCNKDLKNQGSKNLHERACIKNPKNSEDQAPEDDKKEKNNKCEHELLLLNTKVASHKRAVNDGYSAYCLKCNELV